MIYIAPVLKESGHVKIYALPKQIPGHAPASYKETEIDSAIIFSHPYIGMKYFHNYC